MADVHFHVEERIQNDGEFGDWTIVPGLPGVGMEVVKNQSDAEDIANETMFLSRALFNADMPQDSRIGLTSDWTWDEDINGDPDVVYLTGFTHPGNGDMYQVRVRRCESGTVSADSIANLSDDEIGAMISSALGLPLSALSIIEVTPDGTARELNPVGSGETQADPAEFFKQLFSTPPTTDIDGEDGLSSLFGDYTALSGGLQKVS